MEYNPYSFISSDIVVWNGIISEYGAISPLIQDGDNIRRASEHEMILRNLAKSQQKKF